MSFHIGPVAVYVISAPVCKLRQGLRSENSHLIECLPLYFRVLFLFVSESDRSGLFDAVEAEARRRGGNRHCPRNSCADGMVVLPAVPTFPNRRANLSANT